MLIICIVGIEKKERRREKKLYIVLIFAIIFISNIYSIYIYATPYSKFAYYVFF